MALTAAATSTSGSLGDVQTVLDATHTDFRVSVNGLPPVTVSITLPADVAGATVADRRQTLANAITAKVTAQAGGKLALGIDAIGGEATARIGAALDDHGTVVNYGLMSGQNPQLGGWDVVFRGVRLAGFWLVHWFGRHARGEIARVYGQLAGLLADGSIRVPIAARYPLSHAREALLHAAREGRDGKIVIVNEAAAG